MPQNKVTVLVSKISNNVTDALHKTQTQQQQQQSQQTLVFKCTLINSHCQPMMMVMLMNV